MRIYKNGALSSFIAMIVSLFLSQLIAVLTGLASGKIKPVGLPFWSVVIFLILYDVFIVVQCLIGAISIWKLSKCK